jgi:hypothetical protein
MRMTNGSTNESTGLFPRRAVSRCSLQPHIVVVAATFSSLQLAASVPSGLFTVTICNGARCVNNTKLFGPGTPVLEYGQQDAQAGFRCKSARSGISCTVSHPGQGHGKGFLINSASVTLVGP